MPAPGAIASVTATDLGGGRVSFAYSESSGAESYDLTRAKIVGSTETEFRSTNRRATFGRAITWSRLSAGTWRFCARGRNSDGTSTFRCHQITVAESAPSPTTGTPGNIVSVTATDLGNGSVRFDYSSSARATSYRLTGAGQTINRAANLGRSVTFNNVGAGSQTFCARGINASGEGRSRCHTITVTTSRAVTPASGDLSVNAPNSVFPGQNISLTASLSVDSGDVTSQITYGWSVTGPATVSPNRGSSTTLRVNSGATSGQSITLRATADTLVNDEMGIPQHIFETFSATISIVTVSLEVRPNPANVPVGGSVTLRAVKTGTPSVTYNWFIIASTARGVALSTAGSDLATISSDSAGSGGIVRVRLQGTVAGTGQVITVFSDVIVLAPDLPDPTIRVEADDPTMLTNNSTFIRAFTNVRGGLLASVKWSPATYLEGTERAAEKFTPRMAGGYTFTAVATWPDGASISGSVTISVTDSPVDPPTPTGAVSITGINDGDSVFVGQIFGLSADFQPAEGDPIPPVNYSWHVSGHATLSRGNSRDAQIEITESGTITITCTADSLVDTGDEAPDYVSGSAQITIISRPGISLDIAPARRVINIGGSIVLSPDITDNPGIVSYDWSITSFTATGATIDLSIDADNRRCAIHSADDGGPGIVTVRLIVTFVGSFSLQTVGNVAVLDDETEEPTLQVVADKDLLEVDEQTYLRAYANVRGGLIPTVSWVPTDFLDQSNIAAVLFRTRVVGPHTYTATALWDDGRSLSGSVTVTVSSAIDPTTLVPVVPVVPVTPITGLQPADVSIVVPTVLIPYPEGADITDQNLIVENPGLVVHRSPYTGDEVLLNRGTGRFIGQITIGITNDQLIAERIEGWISALVGQAGITRIPLHRETLSELSVGIASSVFEEDEINYVLSADTELTVGKYVKLGDRLLIVTRVKSARNVVCNPQVPVMGSALLEAATDIRVRLRAGRVDELQRTPDWYGPWVVDWTEVV